MKNRFLTLDDLYNYYSSTSKRSRHFSAKDAESNIVVQVPGNIMFEDNNDATEGLTPVRLQACHIDKNRNGSYISQEAMEAALPSFANRPILGYIHEVDGQEEFYSHNMHIEDDEIVYDEVPVGVIKESCNAHLEEDEEKGHTYVVVDGYLYDEYSSASEILKREQQCDVSVELSIREMSFDAKAKVLNLENFFFSGVTILGKDPEGYDVKPGMEGSNITLADFSAKNNSLFEDNPNLISILEELTQKIDALTEININSKKGGAEEMDDVLMNEEVVLEENMEAEAENVAAEESFVEENTSEEVTPDESDEVSEEKFSKTFELSHSDIKCGLYALLSSYEEQDGEWYFISDVYDDHFVYEGMFDQNNIYDQKYSRDGDNIAFEGERVHLNREYLTDDELVQLNNMRSRFDEMSNKLAKYEAEPEKIAVLNSDDYSQIKDTEQYAELSKRENYFDLDTKDLTAKLDAILLDYAKNNKLEFASVENENNTGFLPLPADKPKQSKGKGRYGSTFNKN